MQKTSWKFITFVLCLGVMLMGLDQGIVIPIKQIIAHSIHLSEALSVWILISYSLGTVFSMFLLSVLADKYGLKKILSFSILLFTIASLLCGLSFNFKSPMMLLSSRFMQGFGGGALIPISLSYMEQKLDIQIVGMAMAMIGLTFSIGSILGPTIGSLITSLFGNDMWPLIFYINLFIGIPALFLLPRLEEAPGTNFEINTLQIILFTMSITFFTWFLSVLNADDLINSFKSTDVILSSSLFIIFTILTIMNVIKVDGQLKEVILLFKVKDLRIANIVTFISGLAVLGIMQVSAEYFEKLLKWKEGTSGFILMGVGIFALIVGPMSGKMINTIGPKKLLQYGLLSSIISSIILVLAFMLKIPYLIFASVPFIGIGQVLNNGIPVNILVELNSPHTMIGRSQTMLTLIRAIGITMAPALFKIIFNLSSNISIGVTLGYLFALGLIIYAFILTSKLKDYNMSQIISEKQEHEINK